MLVAVLLLLAPSCTQDDDDPPADAAGSSSASACPSELADPLRAWGRAGFSGTVVVTEGDATTCEMALGLADREEGRPTTLDTTFAIGSVSKAFTAAAVLDLVAAGRLGLDDRAGDHVDGLAGPAADATVEHLLLHTSGLTGSHGEDHQPLDRDAAVAAMSGFEQALPAGSEYSYSNAGYTLLALVVEGVTGEPYRDHLVEEVLTVDGDVLGGFWDGDPAAPGPRAVGYDDEGVPSPEDGSFAGPHWALTGNGDLAMTAPELAAWTRALFTGDVVAPEAVGLLETTVVDQGEGTAEVPGWGRFDAGRFGEALYGSAGGGGDVGQDVVTAWLPESERVVTIASNGTEVTAEDLLAEIARALVAGDPLPEPEVATDVDPDVLAAAAGTYSLGEDGDATLEVAATDDGLSITPTGRAAVAALFPPLDGADAEDRAAHEERVVALLAGETEAGRDELALLEDDLGEVTDVEVVGTVIADRELRTYVTITADATVLAWYAVDDAGSIQAVEITDHHPSLRLVAAGDDVYRATDGSEVTVVAAGDRLTLTGPDGARVVAIRA